MNSSESILPGLFISLTFHLVVFLILPLLAKLARTEEEFIRPETFQLVQPPQRIPHPPAPAKKPKPTPQKPEPPEPAPKKPEPKPEPEPKPGKQREPRRKDAQSRTKETPDTSRQKQQEELEQLAGLLGDMAPATEVQTQTSFSYDWYLNSIRGAIERYWNPQTRDSEIKVRLTFTIYANGSISDVSISHSSGDTFIDKLAIRAVRQAAPFGKLPPGYASSSLQLDCTFRPTKGAGG